MRRLHPALRWSRRAVTGSSSRVMWTSKFCCTGFYPAGGTPLRDGFFKSLNRSVDLGVMTRASGEFAVAHGAQFPAQGLPGDPHPERLKQPLRQIDKTPSYDAMDGGHGSALDHRRQRTKAVTVTGTARVGSALVCCQCTAGRILSCGPRGKQRAGEEGASSAPVSKGNWRGHSSGHYSPLQSTC